MRLLETVREKQKGRQRTVPKIEINCEFALPGVSRTHLFHIPPFVCQSVLRLAHIPLLGGKGIPLFLRTSAS